MGLAMLAQATLNLITHHKFCDFAILTMSRLSYIWVKLGPIYSLPAASSFLWFLTSVKVDIWWLFYIYLEAPGFEIRVKMTSVVKRYPPPFFLRKCHLVENMTQGSNLSNETIFRSEFGVRMDWLSISLLSSNLCICVVMSVRMNSVSKCL